MSRWIGKLIDLAIYLTCGDTSLTDGSVYMLLVFLISVGEGRVEMANPLRCSLSGGWQPSQFFDEGLLLNWMGITQHKDSLLNRIDIQVDKPMVIFSIVVSLGLFLYCVIIDQNHRICRSPYKRKTMSR